MNFIYYLNKFFYYAKILFLSYPFAIFLGIFLCVKFRNKNKLETLQNSANYIQNNAQLKEVRIHFSFIFWLSLLAYVLIF